MNIPALKTELLNLLTSTANLTATEKTKLRNRFVTEYQAEWNARVVAGTADTATNRGIFVIDKTLDYWSLVYKLGSDRENLATLPAPDTLQ
jgi:hypothetical protein